MELSCGERLCRDLLTPMSNFHPVYKLKSFRKCFTKETLKAGIPSLLLIEFKTSSHVWCDVYEGQSLSCKGLEVAQRSIVTGCLARKVEVPSCKTLTTLLSSHIVRVGLDVSFAFLSVRWHAPHFVLTHPHPALLLCRTRANGRHNWVRPLLSFLPTSLCVMMPPPPPTS